MVIAEEIHLHDPTLAKNSIRLFDIVDQFLLEKMREKRRRENEVLRIILTFDAAWRRLHRLPVRHVRFALMRSQLKRELRRGKSLASIRQQFRIDIDTQILPENRSPCRS